MRHQHCGEETFQSIFSWKSLSSTVTVFQTLHLLILK